MLLELNLAAKQHVILSGPHASGKTSILNHFLSSRGLYSNLCHISIII